MTNEEKIHLIGQKIFLLSQNMEKYRAELDTLRAQLEQLKTELSPGVSKEQKIVQVIEPLPPAPQLITQPELQRIPSPKPVTPKREFHLEEYIGGKLVNVIGIILLVIGVSIGVKYAIDNELITPLGRIVLGFAAGALILACSFFTRVKYKLFSAIMLSGSIAIMYFTTYAGYAFYKLYPVEFGFALMVLLTSFTVFAAHIYDYEILAVIALVGAYAVPPLLRDDKGNVHIMFGYMAILNAGILVVSFRKNWNWVTYSGYLLTWLIFGGWMIGAYYPERYFTTCFTFVNIFFLTFYAMFISYKVIKKELFSVFDILRIMSNSAVYFGIGYYLLNTKEHEDYLGLFCIANAFIHLLVAAICYRNKTADKKVVFLILTLVFTFITIAIPVQLEGNWVTMTWFTEIAILWVMAHRFNIPLYRHMAFVLLFCGGASLFHDWTRFYYEQDQMAGASMFANKYFLTSFFALACTGLVKWIVSKEENDTVLKKAHSFIPVYSVFFAVVLGIVSYLAVANEIHLKFENLYNASGIKIDRPGYSFTEYDSTYKSYKILWIILYTALYSVGLNLLNIFRFRADGLRLTAWILDLVSLALCLAAGLAVVADLKYQYHSAIESGSPATAWMHYARYLMLPFIFILLTNLFSFSRQEALKWSKSVNMWIVHAVLVILLSNELTFLLTEANYDQYERMLKISWRTGYTILWTVYSLALIVWGFSRKVKMIRFIGLTLFGISVVYLGVIAFTMSRGYQLITFSAIGVIMILTGFLYQKFKHVLLEKDRDEVEQAPVTENI